MRKLRYKKYNVLAKFLLSLASFHTPLKRDKAREAMGNSKERPEGTDLTNQNVTPRGITVTFLQRLEENT